MPLHRFAFRAMACDNIITIDAPTHTAVEATAQAAIAEVHRIEAKYSRYRSDSVLTAINQQASGVWRKIDRETAQLLDFAAACYAQSDGLFDITSGVLRRVWDFKATAPPCDDAIASVLPRIGWPYVERTSDAMRFLRDGMEIDLGGFGKEYAADRAAAVLLAHGIRHGFVDLGGDVVVTGPMADGTPWRLGIRHPRAAVHHEDALLETVSIVQGAVATSGDYERYLIDAAGRRHCHILNPMTGQAVQGLQCVTAFAPTCMVAGAITTIAMLRGEAGGLAFLRASDVVALAVGRAGEVHRIGGQQRPQA
jgi:thiamine biosynthesis lipoprotein